MPDNSFSLKSLEAFINKHGRIRYHDKDKDTGKDKIETFYGKLLGFDTVFQSWEGKNHPSHKEIFLNNFNHNDVSRIVVEVGGING